MKRFAEDPQGPGVIPNFTRARQLYENDPQAFHGMAFGLARPLQRNRFAYAFGNPTVVPQGPGYASRKSSGLAIVSLGTLQVWVVDPTIFPAAKITLPTQVVALRPRLSFRDLRDMPVLPSLEDVVVNNGEHDVVRLVEQLIAWSEAYSLEPRVDGLAPGTAD